MAQAIVEDQQHHNMIANLQTFSRIVVGSAHTQQLLVLLLGRVSNASLAAGCSTGSAQLLCSTHYILIVG